MNTYRLLNGVTFWSGLDLYERSMISLLVLVGKAARSIRMAWKIILVTLMLVGLVWQSSTGVRESMRTFVGNFYENEIRESPADGAAWILGFLLAAYVIVSTYLYITTPNHAAPAFFKWWITWFLSTLSIE